MSCILRIWGENFNVDDFILKSKLSPYDVFYKGSSRNGSKPAGEKIKSTGCKVEVSRAGFDEFKQQVRDAIDYLNTHQQKLKYINSTPEIQYVVLDFGVEYDSDKFTQSQYLPTELLRLSSDLGIGIEISIYQKCE